MTLGGADWPSGSPPEQWDALPAASKWQIILFVGMLELFDEDDVGRRRLAVRLAAGAVGRAPGREQVANYPLRRHARALRRVRRAALHDGPETGHVPVVLRRVRRGRGLPAPRALRFV